MKPEVFILLLSKQAIRHSGWSRIQRIAWNILGNADTITMILDTPI